MKRKISMLIIAVMLFSVMVPVSAEEDVQLMYTSFANNTGITFLSTDGSGIGTENGLTAKTKNTADGKGGSAIASMGSLQWKDYTVETSFTAGKTSNEDDRVVFEFKKKNKYNSYAAVFSVQRGILYICKDKIDYFTESSYTKQEHKAQILTDKPNTLKISSVGSKISIVLNDETVLDYEDIDPVPYGGISVGIASGGEETFNAKFSFLSVTGKNHETPAISGTIVGNKEIFSEDFNSDLSAWKFSGSCDISEEGEYRMMKLGEGDGTSAAYIQKSNFSDFSLDWYSKAVSNTYSIYTRYAGVNLYYRFDFSKEEGGTVKIVKRVDKEERVLASETNVKERFGLDIGEFSLIRIVCSGENLGVFYGVPKKPVVTFCDLNSGVLDGRIGFEASEAYFDDIIVSTGGSAVEVYNYDPIKPIDKANMSDADETGDVYAELFVSNGGNDENDGSSGAPFKTIERAVRELERLTEDMTGNIVINVESGTYEMKEPIRIDNKHSGKNGYYVIFRSTGGRSVVSGGQKVKNKWIPYDAKIYKTSIDSLYEEGFKEFYVNGERKVRAGSYEMNPEFLLYSDDDKTYDADGLYISKSLLPEVKHPEDLEWISNIAWRSFHCPVDSIETSYNNENYLLLKMRQPAFDHAYELGPSGANTATHRAQRIRIENALELLDEPGEWYYDKREHILYYYPDVYEDINTAECFIPGIENLILVEGESRENRAGYVTFSGFDFCHTGFEYALKYGYITNQTPFIKDMNPDSPTLYKEYNVSYAVKVQNANNIKLYDNKFSNLGSSAMIFADAVSNVSITGNVIDDIADTGIVIGQVKSDSHALQWDYLTPPDNFYIANNIINDIGAEYEAGIGIITTFATNIWILHNEISNVGLNPLSLGWGWAYPATMNLHSNCTMYNVLRDYNYKQLLHDLAAVYMLSAQQKSIIAENYFINDFGGSYGAIYYDQGASYVLSANNVIKDVNASVFILSAERHDNLAVNNYTTDPGVTNSGTDSYVADLLPIKNYNWPSAARRIIENAGLEENYEYLRDYRTNTSVCLDNAYKMSAYKDGSSSMLRFGALMPINNTDPGISARVIDGKLYLPREEIEKVCFTNIPSFLGAAMSYDKSSNTVVCTFSKNSGGAPMVLKAPVGDTEWDIDGKSYIAEAPVIVENDKAYISVEDVFKCFGIAKKVVYYGDIAAVCEKGFDFSFEGNENTAKYISDRLSR